MNFLHCHSRLRVAVAPLLLLSATALAIAQPRMPEDVFPQLEDILEATVTQSPRMLMSQLDVEASEGDLTQAKAGLYPTLGGFYQLTATRDKREDQQNLGFQPVTKNYYNIALTQPLFYWGERSNNAKIGEIRLLIAQEKYAQAYGGLAQQVRRNYLELATLKVRLKAARFDLDLAQQALKEGQGQVDKGVMAESRLLPLRIDKERHELALAQLESAAGNLRRLLGILTGSATFGEAEVPEGIPPLNANANADAIKAMLGEFLSTPIPSTPQLDVLEKQIQVANLTYENQKKRLLPKVNLVAGINQDQQSYTENVAAKYAVLSQYVGVQVNWSIFDGFARRGAVKTSLARKRQAEINYRLTADTIQNQAQNAAQAIAAARREMAINDRLLENSETFLKFRRNDQRRGQASENDINSAVSSYNSSVVAANLSRYNYLMRVAEFVALVGKDPAIANLKAD